MYSYEHDSETGGLILTSSPVIFSKEPRPVYAPELDMLGFSHFMQYSSQTDSPYMWAESNNYFYRGVKVASVSGGNLYTAPTLTLTPEGQAITGELEPVDIPAMCRKNAKILGAIEEATVKRIVDIYERYKPKVDVFHVAFSGGKDSAVLLDLVKKSLPEKSFVVVFGDTGMEFPDTYRAVDVTLAMCEAEDIPFYVARSHLRPEESWRMFGPPARHLRWCCGVHKNAPQVLKLREVMKKKNYRGLAFVGIRKHESIARSKYEYENFGAELKGQISINSILEWTSAEIWAYIFANNIFVNASYKKGISRAGCLLCPMGGGKNDFLQAAAYPEGVSMFAQIINEMNARGEGDAKELKRHICNGGWNARRNGRDLKRKDKQQYIEDIRKGEYVITSTNPRTDWREWLKTLGDLPFTFTYNELPDGYEIKCPMAEIREFMIIFSKFKFIFKRSTYCMGCRVCEANCPRGCISFKNGLKITGCIQCGACLELDEGCLAYNSLRMPYEGVVNMKGKSINQFSNHAPKSEWVENFLRSGNDYWDSASLGSEQIRRFRQFLFLCEITDKENNTTDFFEILRCYGWDNSITWGLILTNLAYGSSQIQWYILNMDIGTEYSRNTIKNMLTAEGLKEAGVSSVIYSFKRLCELPLGRVIHFGHVGRKDEMTRTECTIDDNKVLLYALYKFAEKCNLDREFSLAYLLADDSDRDGISPVRIFGLKDTDSMTGIRSRLLGLSAAYPDFINATFTNDLQTITLRDKTPEDVLALFRKE